MPLKTLRKVTIACDKTKTKGIHLSTEKIWSSLHSE